MAGPCLLCLHTFLFRVRPRSAIRLRAYILEVLLVVNREMVGIRFDKISDLVQSLARAQTLDHDLRMYMLVLDQFLSCVKQPQSLTHTNTQTHNPQPTTPKPKQNPNLAPKPKTQT